MPRQSVNESISLRGSTIILHESLNPIQPLTLTPLRCSSNHSSNLASRIIQDSISVSVPHKIPELRYCPLRKEIYLIPPLPGGTVDGIRTSAAEIRDHAAATLSPETQQRLEQFLTPAPVTDQAASLFTPTRQPVHILDLGSGTGILAAAVAERSADGSSVVAVEQDANLAVDSKRTLAQVCHNTKVINASVYETRSTRCSTVPFSIPRTRKSARSAFPQARATSR